MLCFLASSAVELDERERHAAVRRAELLLATGGDPRRALRLYGRATTALAQDLDTPERRSQLLAGLVDLQAHAGGLPGAEEALRLLLGDADLTWQCFAMAILAEELADET